MNEETKNAISARPKKKRPCDSSPVIGDNGVNTLPGDNSRYAALALEVSSWPRIDRNDVDALNNRLKKYIEFCIENDTKIGNMGCYLALGIDKNIAWEWSNGISGTSLHRDFIKKVKAICAGTREYLMQDGKINCITGIFWQKNYDGLKDQQDIVVTPNNPIGDLSDPEQIKRRYLAAAPDSDE